MIEKIIKYKWFALSVPIVLVVALMMGAKNLRMSNDYHMFFASDNPQLVAFDNLQDTYNKTDNILIGLRDTKNGIFTEENLRAIAALTKEAWKTPYSSRVDSLGNYQHTYAEGDDLIVADLVDLELDKLDTKNIATTALGEVLLKNRLITDAKDTTALNITLELPRNEAEATTAQAEAVAFVRAFRDKIKVEYPQFEVFLSGLVMLNNAFPEAVKGDMQSLVPLSFGLIFVLLMVLLRSITVVLGAVLLMVFTILGAMGFAGHMGFPITPPLASLPTVVLTITVAGSVHLMMSFTKHLRLGETKVEAMSNAFNHNAKAIVIAAITTAIGFLGLNFAEVPPFHDMGNVAAFGTLLALFLILIWLPAWLVIIPMRVKKSQRSLTTFVDSVAEFIISKQNKVFAVSALIALVFISLIPLNEIDDNFVEYFDKSVEMRRDTDKVDKYLTGIGSIDYSFESGEDNGIAKVDFLADVDKFVTWVRTLPEVNNVSALTDIIKRLNKNMHADDEHYYKLPDNRELSAQYLLLYEMSLPYGLDLNNQINTAKSAIRVSVNMKNMSSNGYLALADKIDAWLKKNTPNIYTEGASPSIMFAHIGKRNVVSMFFGTAVSLVIISALLMLFLRSFRVGMVSLIPNLVPAIIAFGLWALVDGTITMSLAVVASITLGIIVDDTVHFLTQFNHAMQKLGKNAADSVRYAFHHVGNALIISSVALSAGFLVLVQSVFRLNSGMGELTAYVIMIALIMDLLLLPAILLKIYK